MTFSLGVGMGAGDRLDLTDEVNYLVLARGFRVDDDGADRRYVYVTLPLHVRGATINDALNARRAIITKLNQATIGGTAVNDWVTLEVQVTGADTPIWWHVVEGGIPEPGVFRPFGRYIGVVSEPLLLSLRCFKGAFGAPIVDDPVTVLGSDPTLYRAGIPGDLPAHVEMVLTDASTGGVVLHGIGVGSRSMGDMLDADFEPVQNVTATGIGATDDSDSDRFGADYVTATPGLTFERMATVVLSPAILKDDFDLWLRVRDDSTFLDTPEGVVATTVEGANIRQSVQTTEPEETSVTLDTQTLAGNTGVLKVHLFGSNPAITAAPADWTLIESIFADGAPDKIRTALYYYPNAPSLLGELAFTFTDTTAAFIRFEEWTGFTATPLDVSESLATDNATSQSTGTTAITAQADALAMSMHSISGSQFIGSYEDDDVIALYNHQIGPSADERRAISAYKILAATGTQEIILSTNSADGANLIAVFKASVAGQLAADTYAYRVTALDADGNESAGSTTMTVNHPSGSANATQLEWEASESPAVTGYRVYVKKGTDSWVYFDTGSADPTYLHTTMTDPTGTADPPDIGLTTAQIRLGLALGANGTVTSTTDPVRPVKGNSVWEWLRISSETLSPLAVPLSVAQPDYRLDIETRQGSSSDTLAVDALALIPNDEAWFEADVRNEDLAAVREWVMGTNQAGHSYAFIRDPADATDVSGAFTSGVLAVGPGATKLVFLLRGANDAAVVAGVSVNVALTIWPRYRWAVGSL